MGRPNAIDVVEACYRVDLGNREWMEGIAEVAAKVVGSNLGALIYMYDGRERSLCFSRNFDPAWVAAFTDAYVEGLLPEKKRRGDRISLTTAALAPVLAGRSCPVTTVPSLAPMVPYLPKFGGARDLFTLNGYDPTGCGLSLGIPLLRRMEASRARDRVFARVTTHLSAAYRLRRRLSRAEPPEALLTPSGKLVDARGDAVGAKAALRASTLLYDRARSRKVRADPERATAMWRALVSARWTLLDDFAADGKHFVIARRNDLQLDLDVLTERERQVLAHAMLERSNKEIAYELGLADSTVRVLLLRAATKMGAKGRADAIERFRRLISKKM